MNHFWELIYSQEILLMIPLFTVKLPKDFVNRYSRFMILLNLSVSDAGNEFRETEDIERYDS